jgi:hypothetical protein
MQYLCEATTATGFVQQVACQYLPHGYWFFVTGWVPEGKDPRRVDRRLLDKYGIAVSRQARARRKLKGDANLHYIRHRQLFAILATYGQHRFYDEEGDRVRDIRRLPLHFQGYSITYKQGNFKRRVAPDLPAEPDDKWHARVQMGLETYREWEAYFLDLAVKRSVEALGRELYNVPFEPYAPVRQQLLNILRLINDARRAAGFDPVPPTVLRYQRRIVKPFEPEEASLRTPVTVAASRAESGLIGGG